MAIAVKGIVEYTRDLPSFGVDGYTCYYITSIDKYVTWSRHHMTWINFYPTDSQQLEIFDEARA